MFEKSLNQPIPFRGNFRTRTKRIYQGLIREMSLSNRKIQHILYACYLGDILMEMFYNFLSARVIKRGLFPSLNDVIYTPIIRYISDSRLASRAPASEESAPARSLAGGVALDLGRRSVSRSILSLQKKRPWRIAFRARIHRAARNCRSRRRLIGDGEDRGVR